MTKYTLKDAGQQCWGVYDGDRLVARIVPHGLPLDPRAGWKAVDLDGKALTTQSYETPKLVLQYLSPDL